MFGRSNWYIGFLNHLGTPLLKNTKYKTVWFRVGNFYNIDIQWKKILIDNPMDLTLIANFTNNFFYSRSSFLHWRALGHWWVTCGIKRLSEKQTKCLGRWTWPIKYHHGICGTIELALLLSNTLKLRKIVTPSNFLFQVTNKYRSSVTIPKQGLHKFRDILGK